MSAFFFQLKYSEMVYSASMAALIDLTDQIFGRLKVLKRTAFEKLKPHWLCHCECGQATIASSLDLKSGDKKSCGCLRKDLQIINLEKKSFGKLTVLEKTPKRGKSSSQFWRCKCECGVEKNVSSQHLREGHIDRCGQCDKKIDYSYYESQFLENIEKTESCWLWKGRLTKGYGIFKAHKFIKSHRFSFLIFRGPIPKGKIICHTCDNPQCVNPEHLWLGTYKENALDMVKKGRGRKPKSLSRR